jgi:hypothetical protein
MNRRTTLVLAAALLVMPAFAADPTGFALWKSAELKQRDEALSKKLARTIPPERRWPTTTITASECSIGTRTDYPSSTTT